MHTLPQVLGHQGPVLRPLLGKAGPHLVHHTPLPLGQGIDPSNPFPDIPSKPLVTKSNTRPIFIGTTAHVIRSGQSQFDVEDLKRAAITGIVGGLVGGVLGGSALFSAVDGVSTDVSSWGRGGFLTPPGSVEWIL